MPRPATVLLRRLTGTERVFVVETLRQETVGGLILLAAAVAAMVWANVGLGSYDRLRGVTFGPSVLHLHLSLQDWGADGLLAVFFFVAGLELKRELTVGSLREPRDAVLPIVAAVCGMAVPAAIFAISTAGDAAAARGWAVPTATDLAFCLAVLAIAGSALPSSLRAFLLTLAVVDDALSIVLIAVFYTSTLHPLPLLGAVVAVASAAVAQQRRVGGWPLLAVLGLLAWGLTHASGIHPTVVAVALGLVTRVRPRPDERVPPAERYEHALRPFSAGVAVPVFALLSTGVAVSASSISALVHDRVSVGILAARIVGKPVGVFGGTWLAARLTAGDLHPDLGWSDVGALSMLTGIGFAVPLLVSSVAYGVGSATDRVATTAILVSAVLTALLAALALRRRHRHYLEVRAAEDADHGADGTAG